jgi:hypothetical protein
MASAAHRTHAYSIYRELVHEHVILERPEYDVAERLETTAAGGLYYRWLAGLGARVCLTKAALVAACFPKRVFLGCPQPGAAERREAID